MCSFNYIILKIMDPEQKLKGQKEKVKSLAAFY